MKNILLEYLQNAYPERKNMSIHTIHRISDGWESELYDFTLQFGSLINAQSDRLILRIYPGDGAEVKAKREFTNMKRLYEVGYPVPRVFFLEETSDLLGRPFVIMEYIEGKPLWSMISESNETEARKLIGKFIELFVQLHALEWRMLVDDPTGSQWEDPYYFADRWLRDARTILNQAETTEFFPVVDWLQERRDALGCSSPAVTHQDFHPNNVLIQKDGRGVVIDWTNFEISDRRMDLAWTLVLANAYEGMAVRDIILSEYQRQSQVKLEQIDVFEVFACARRLFDISSSIAMGAERRGMRPEAVEMMKGQMPAHKRVYEMLYTRTGIHLPTLEKLFS